MAETISLQFSRIFRREFGESCDIVVVDRFESVIGN
jgi:hypothetical protein